MSVAEQSAVLSSWKDIARYVGKGVRTVQRWEHELGLPVRRPNGASQKSAVMLQRSELDLWLETRFSPRKGGNTAVPAGQYISRASRAALRENIGKARELRSANLELAQQLVQSLRRLTQQCATLGSLSNQVPIAPLKPSGRAFLVAESGSLITGPELTT